ncbi:MAG: ferritin-like domain-containing protein [Mycobacterium sp.]
MTSPQPTPSAAPGRPADAANGALFDAVATEHATIYGYGLVSAHSSPDVNNLVSTAMAEHRNRREAAIGLLKARSVNPPLPAAGYQLPMAVNNPTDAANLAVRMEGDTAVAWRAVLEQATDEQTRALAVTAMSQCAVTAAKWRRALGFSPISVAFPGGTE